MILKNIKRLLTSGFNRQEILKGKNILVVEDGEIERKIYTNALESSGACVLSAASGAAAQEIIASQRFDLILLDYLLPDTDGIKLCQSFKVDNRTRGIPIIFLTGSMKPEGVISCYDAGADCYLSKPISAVALIQQVRMTLIQEGR